MIIIQNNTGINKLNFISLMSAQGSHGWKGGSIIRGLRSLKLVCSAILTAQRSRHLGIKLRQLGLTASAFIC